MYGRCATHRSGRGLNVNRETSRDDVQAPTASFIISYIAVISARVLLFYNRQRRKDQKE